MSTVTVKKIKKVKSKKLVGEDSEGKVYKDIQDFWKERVGDESTGGESKEKEEKWYKKSVGYWSDVDATTDGVLGGFGFVSLTDLTGSQVFLKLLKCVDFSGPAADCGAGIGRTTKGLLCPLFPKVDLIEPTPKFVEKAREIMKDIPSMGEFLELGLEKWVPTPGYYSLIWCQWVLPYLTDVDLIAFLKRCAVGLRPGGIIGVKENIATSNWIADNDDYSITRTEDQYRKVFEDAGLEVISDRVQLGLPKELFKVKMFALVPKVESRVESEANQTANGDEAKEQEGKDVKLQEDSKCADQVQENL